MDWFRTQWRSLQRGVDRWTGLGTVWRGTQGAFQQHAAYIKIGLVVLAFALALWLVWSVVFHFAQTFLMLRNISSFLGWAFLVLVFASIGWLAWFIRKTLRNVQSSRASGVFQETKEEEKVDPTAAYLQSLPKPPQIGLLDVLQPGARALVETLMFARDPASYEQALAQLERQEERDGRAPEWMLARAQILLHLGRQPQAYRIFAEVQQRYAKTRYAQDAALLDLAARLEFGHEAMPLPHEKVEPPKVTPSLSLSRSVQAPLPQEEDIFRQATVMTRPNLLQPEEMEQMLRSPSSDQLPQARGLGASAHVARPPHSDEGLHTEDDLVALEEEIVEDDLEAALSSLPSAFGQEDHYSLQTVVKRPVAPISAAALLAPSSSNEQHLGAPDLSLHGAFTPTPHVVEEEELSRHLPLLDEEIFSDAELEKLSFSMGGLPSRKGPHSSKDAEISALLAEIDSDPFAQSTVRQAPLPRPLESKTQPNQAYAPPVPQRAFAPPRNPPTPISQGPSSRRDVEARDALGRIEAEIEAWLRRNPPMLGGILLEDARRYEGLLEEADHLREAGQRQKAHLLLQDILRLSPSSRYAKDAEMRLLSDKLFVSSSD